MREDLGMYAMHNRWTIMLLMSNWQRYVRHACCSYTWSELVSTVSEEGFAGMHNNVLRS
jgi:hypothetical protein